MTKQTEALRMAMRWITDVSTNSEVDVLNAIDEALAETQEPVAWMNDIAFSMDKELLGTRSRIVPLYTTPPSREWQSLSDDDLYKILNDNIGSSSYAIAHAISEALREKNT